MSGSTSKAKTNHETGLLLDLLPSNVSQCQAIDSHKHLLNWLVHMFFSTDVYYNCRNLTVLRPPVKKPFVLLMKYLARYEWIIDCFLQVTGHWHQV